MTPLSYPPGEAEVRNGISLTPSHSFALGTLEQPCFFVFEQWPAKVFHKVRLISLKLITNKAV